MRISNLLSLPSLPLSERANLPNDAGIYFAVAKEQVLYIGRAINLHRRWRQHHRYDQLKAFGDVRLYWLPITEMEFLEELEASLIKHFKPVLNQTFLETAGRLALRVVTPRGVATLRVVRRAERQSESKHFRSELRLLREAAGHTQESLSRILGLSKSIIGFYEAGQKLPRVDNFLAMCRALNVSPKTLARAMQLDISDIPDDQPLIPATNGNGKTRKRSPN